jgi:hypothetical protein
MELGIWDGGSTAFWYELFEPQKHIALDIQDQRDTPYFRPLCRVSRFGRADQDVLEEPNRQSQAPNDC